VPGSAGLLFAARALQGAAVGTATSALGAALIDLQPAGSRRAPVITTALVYCVTVAVLAAVAAGSLLLRGRPRPGSL
jgi:MFS family permease